MQLTEITFTDQPPIDAYGSGYFKVNEVAHEGPILLSAAGITPWSGWDDLEPILSLAGEFDLLFAGMGAEITPVPKAARLALDNAGIAVEPMASPSACRTYNILLSEGRRIALAAIPI